MNKRILAVVVALVVVIVGAVGLYAVTRSPEAPSAQSPASVPSAGPAEAPAPGPAEPSPAETGSAATSAGVYIDYSDTAIAAAQGRTFLFFHAPWCPQCRSLESDILAVGVPDGITIIKVDYDSHQDLRQTYGVTQQTTLVEVDATGKGLQNYLAYSDPRLQVVLDAML